MNLTPDQWQAAVAVLVPLVVGLLKQARLPDVYNALIAIAVYVVAGLVAVPVSGQALTIDNIVPAIATFTAVGTIAYQLFWKSFESTAAAARLRLGHGPA